MSVEAWIEGPERPVVEDQQVDLWLIERQDAPEHLIAALSEAERKRATKMREDVAARFLLAQCALREILARYLGLPAGELRYRIGPHGKPYLVDTPFDVQFNLTHSGELTLVGVTRDAELGVDLEQIREVRHAAAVARKFFPAEDAARWQAAPVEEQGALFIQMWTEVEAVGKAWGIGVGRGLSREGISLLPVAMPGDYRASIARFGPVTALNRYRWQSAAD